MSALKEVTVHSQYVRSLILSHTVRCEVYVINIYPIDDYRLTIAIFYLP